MSLPFHAPSAEEGDLQEHETNEDIIVFNCTPHQNNTATPNEINRDTKSSVHSERQTTI